MKVHLLVTVAGDWSNGLVVECGRLCSASGNSARHLMVRT